MSIDAQNPSCHNVRVSKQPISLFDFSDYRHFLASYFERGKKKNPLWSYRAWAKSLGLRNNVSLLRALHGQRHAGPSLLRKLESYFAFDEKELEYFRTLVALSKSRTNPEHRALWMRRLNQLRPRRRQKVLDEKAFPVLSSWYCFAIWEAMKLRNSDSDPRSFSKRFLFDLSSEQVLETIQAFSDLELASFDENTGEWRLEIENLSTSDDIASHAIKRHHESVLQNAKLALWSVSPKERQISGTSIAMKTDQIPEAKKMIREFEDEFDRRFSSSPGEADTVYQFEVALFPLTQGETKS